MASEHEGNLQMDGGKTVAYEYVMQPHMVPVYGYMQTSCNRDQINLDEWSNKTPNVKQRDRTLWKGMKQYFNELFYEFLKLMRKY